MKDDSVKTALIMAAGYGTRLEPLTLAVPKPMVPIANKPTMRHNIELLRKYGIRRIIANIHYHPEQIVNYFSDGSEFGVHLSYSYEEELMGTAGGVHRMGTLVEKMDDTFLVLSSDALTDINLRKFVDFHKKKNAIATIALSPVPDVENFGVVEIDNDKKILSFQEKPKQCEAKSNLVNTGIYIFEPEILDMIPSDTFYDFGKDLFPLLVEENKGIYGYEMLDYWSDVGNLSAYVQANYDAMEGKVRIIVPGKKTSACIWVGKNCKIDPTAKFEGCVIVGDRVEIRANSYVKDCVIGDMVVISSECEITKSVIWSDSFISRKAKINGSVIGNWCFIGEHVCLEEHSILSNRSKILKDTTLCSSAVLKPSEIL